jgi:glycosyltransferase involved in cell wall biosynthesis
LTRIAYLAFGHSIHTIKWVNYFRDIGYDIMLISFYPCAPIEGIDLRYIPCANRYSPLFKVGKVKRLLREFKPDILHAHYASSCGIVAAMTGFHPFVLSVWGDDIFEFPRKSIIHKWAIMKTISIADYVTATSKMLADKTSELIDGNKKIGIIPFGVILDLFKFLERPARDTITIGSVRNLTPKYGLKYLIEAFASLVSKYKNVRLVIVGEGQIRRELESLATGLGVEHLVNFVGRVPNDKIVTFMHKFDIFVMPSVGEGETFGVAAVEAMATGLPVVASRIGGLPEVVDDGSTGILVKPGDCEDLKNALEYYLTHPAKMIEHGQKGRKKVENNYDWRLNAALMEKLYNEIIPQEHH